MSEPSALMIQSLEKGLAVLESFRAHASLTLQEIARENGITMGSAQRVAHTLERGGYLWRDPRTKRYSVTVKAVGLGYSYLYRQPLFQHAHAVLHQVNQECGEIVNLGVPDDQDNMVFVMRVAPARHIPEYMPAGTRIPCVASASGRALWALLPPAELDRKLRGVARIKHTPRSTTDLATLRAFIDEARRDQYAYADEEFYPGDLNVAAVIHDDQGQPMGALNISVPKPRWSLERARSELGPLVIRAARAISKHA
ncbi:Acetate operon repressor [Achromobacter denitrificans]|uniref:IclR family transcriptional regulator n=1 Tax=Achromobacter denitrificans TaxID=32002 RepID=UPI000961B336|nr:IclR family transcriptional regulator [Achromobacter denitrificans]OLU09345.1 transcriptional regulator [Achromobacter denitrificans]CAB3700223.1 Transcriptional repressor IclR [Achromobacter denitrificans]SUU25650.1 Acetate operon repressor [Achromobacter denitrificans]